MDNLDFELPPENIENIAANLTKILGKNNVVKKSDALYQINTNTVYPTISQGVCIYLAKENDKVCFTDYGANIDAFRIDIKTISPANKNMMNALLKFNLVAFNKGSFSVPAVEDYENECLTRLLSILLILPAFKYADL